MRLFFDRSLSRLVRRVGYTDALAAISFKKGDATTLEVRFYDDGSPVELGLGYEMYFVIKDSFAESAVPLAMASNWTLIDGAYVATFSTNTTELVAKVGSLASVKLKGELSFYDAAGGATSSQTLEVTVFNDLVKGDEASPTKLPQPEDWLALRALNTSPLVTGWTGGGPTNLDGIASGLVVDRVQVVQIADVFYIYRLVNVLGGAVDAPPEIVAADANPEMAWLLIGRLPVLPSFATELAARENGVSQGALYFDQVSGVFRSVAGSRAARLWTADFALDGDSHRFTERVMSDVPVAVECDNLPIGDTAAVEWAGVGKVSLTFSGQFRNAADRVLELKERGATVLLYRASEVEIVVRNPADLRSNASGSGGADDSDIVFQLVGNNLLAANYYDTRGTGKRLSQTQANTTIEPLVVADDGIAVAAHFRITAFSGSGIETELLDGDHWSRILSFFVFGATTNFKQYFTGTGTAERSYDLATVLGHPLAVGEELRIVTSITAGGLVTTYINGMVVFNGISVGTTAPGRLKAGANFLPIAMRVWNHSLSNDAILEQTEWLDNN